MHNQNEQLIINTFKIIVLGEASVGKSSLLLRYVNNKIKPPKSTIGVDILTKKVKIDKKIYKLQLWDTAGHEKFRSLVYNYFKLAHAAIVVFQIDNEYTLKQAKHWLLQISIQSQQKIPILLVANKCDLFEGQDLQKVLKKYQQKIQNLRKQFECQFIAVSALTGQNIELCFNKIISKLNQKVYFRADTLYSASIKLRNQQQRISRDVNKSKNQCC